MKTMRYISILLAVAVVCGCTKSNENVILPETQLTITAGFAEDGNTKTLLQDTGVYWEVGDEIKVFYGEGSGRFASTNNDVAKTASFSGSINTVIGSEEGFAGGEYMWGLYPYRSDATYDGTSVTTIIPDQQTGKAGSFAKNMNISIAKSSNLALSFYNVCGGLRFSVTRSDITDVVFEGRNNENIAGTVQVAFSEGVPVIQNLTNGQKKITLTAPNSGTFESGKWYYIIAAPGTLSNGFKLTFNTATQYAELEKTNEVTIKRSIFGSVENADDGLVFQTKETPSGNIVFKDPIAKYACVEKFDTNEDGELSYDEAAAVTDISGLFTNYNTVTSFDELKYFTSLTNIGSAMKYLAKLKSVTLPSQVTSIPEFAFQNCIALDSITVMSRVITSISDHSFSNCQSLESFNVITGLTSIGNYAFDGCKKLKSFDFPSSLSVIGNYAFKQCESIISADIPNSVTSFGSGVFSGCSSLESAILPYGMTFIPYETFSECTSLVHITFPNAVATIGDNAFSACSFLNQSTHVAKIELPPTITSIGNKAFNNARNVLVTSNEFVTIQSKTFTIGTRIYVPDDKVELYKTSIPQTT